MEAKTLDSLMATAKWESDSVVKESEQPIIKSFSFDPNQSTREELTDLGFNKSLANRIINYRAKGGKFFVKRDLLKIYGMDSMRYQKLIPYISLPESISKEKASKNFETKEKPVVAKFDLNQADTSQLMKIYGIGPKLSLRIVSYREKLGGFISQTQLHEVYGLDSVVVKELITKSFIEENFQPKQINVNAADEKDLGVHPYIKYKLARAIVAYRMQHGAFTAVDDLKKLSIIDETTFSRMKPYLNAP